MSGPSAVNEVPITDRSQLVEFMADGAKPPSRLAHRHRAREVRLPTRRSARADMGRRSRHRAAARWHDALRLGARVRRRQADRAHARQRIGDARARRPARAFRRAARDDPRHVLRGRQAPQGSQDGRRRARARLPRHGFPAEMAPRRDAVDAQGPLRDHAPLHAAGRLARPGHDDAHVHRAGQSRLLRRSRHDQEVPRRPCAAADRDGALRRFAVHRRQAERIPELSLAHLDRHRSRSHRHARFRVRATASGSSATSITCSTCRCISAIATDKLHRSRRQVVPRFSRRQAARASRRDADAEGLGRSHDDRVSRSAAQEVSRDARRRRRTVESPVRVAGVLGRAALRSRPRSMRRGIWSRISRAPSAMRCATACPSTR